MNNLSEYSRQMLLNGQVVKKEFREIRGLTAQIGRLGGNINQIAKRANEKRVVPKSDIDEVALLMRTILRILKSDLKAALK